MSAKFYAKNTLRILTRKKCIFLGAYGVEYNYIYI